MLTLRRGIIGVFQFPGGIWPSPHVSASLASAAGGGESYVGCSQMFGQIDKTSLTVFTVAPTLPTYGATSSGELLHVIVVVQVGQSATNWGISGQAFGIEGMGNRPA